MAPRLLVVDDDPAVRESFVRLLRHYGYMVEESATGRAALQRLRSHPFDLAVIDWRLTDMTGLDVAQGMRDSGVRTPWVLVSAYMDYEVARQAGGLGAIKTLGYPIDINGVVADALKGVSARSHGWPSVPALPITASMSPPARWAAFVLHVYNAESDPATIPACAVAANANETTLYGICRLLNVSARDTRDLARVLRALHQCAGRVGEIEGHLVVADVRTWAALLDRAGLRGRPPDAVISVEEFLQVQRFVPQAHLGLAALRASFLQL